MILEELKPWKLILENIGMNFDMPSQGSNGKIEDSSMFLQGQKLQFLQLAKPTNHTVWLTQIGQSDWSAFNQLINLTKICLGSRS
jgi:hypothetical protein